VLIGRVVTALLDHAVANAPAKSVVDVEGERVGDGRFRIRIVHRGRAIGAATLDKFFTTLPLRFCRLAAIRHGASLRAVSPVADGVGLALELELRD
jgi:K+-sensing histidine kinase KdpD